MIETLINSIGFAICFGALIVHQMYLNSLRKCQISCMEELSRVLSNGEVQINENFDKIKSCLNTLEHEIFNIAKNIPFNKDLKSGSNHLVIGPSHLVRTKSLKPISKKFQKFLTPKGKIKKQYRDNPIAHECYQKFQALKQA